MLLFIQLNWSINAWGFLFVIQLCYFLNLFNLSNGFPSSSTQSTDGKDSLPVWPAWSEFWQSVAVQSILYFSQGKAPFFFSYQLNHSSMCIFVTYNNSASLSRWVSKQFLTYSLQSHGTFQHFRKHNFALHVLANWAGGESFLKTLVTSQEGLKKLNKSEHYV